jgi:GT2 family glycosyltransferase
LRGTPKSLSVSVVVYRPDVDVLERTLITLSRSVLAARAQRVLGTTKIIIVDNGSQQRTLDDVVRRTVTDAAHVSILRGHGNIGYGPGHNLGIFMETADEVADLHLVLNPDVELLESTLSEAIRYLEWHPEVVLLAPMVHQPNGEIAYLARRYPSAGVLLLRGFAPTWMRRRLDGAMRRYEMRDVVGVKPTADVPLVSGCFMLARAATLRKVGGFDERYFLYFEDHDLSLAMGREGVVRFVEDVRIVHNAGGVRRKGLRHIAMYCASAVKFFRKHGWELW